jgi:hypothetical protein
VSGRGWYASAVGACCDDCARGGSCAVRRASVGAAGDFKPTVLSGPLFFVGILATIGYFMVTAPATSHPGGLFARPRSYKSNYARVR